MKLKFLFIAAVCILPVGRGYGQEPTAMAAPSPSVVAASVNTPINLGTSKGYMIGPGDQITAVVAGEKDYDFIVTVDEDGKIEVPFSDKPIMARCMTERELRNEVTKLLSKYLRDPQVNIRTEKRSRPQATVYGEVNYPTRFDMLRKATLVELIAFAGGLKEEAGGLIQVSRPTAPLCAAENDPDNWKTNSPDPTIVPSRIYTIADIKAGRPDSNPTIYPGDVIYVHKAAPIYLTGEVFSPQGIYLKDGGLSLTQAIAKVGGPKGTARRSAIKIRRLKPGTTDQYVEIVSANYDLIMAGKEKDVMLQPYDIIEVDKAKDSIAKQVLAIALGAGKAGVYSMTTAIPYRVIY